MKVSRLREITRLAILFVVLLTSAGVAERPAAQPDNIVKLQGSPLEMLELDPGLMHYSCATRDGSAIYPEYGGASAAYRWIDILQEVTATDVESVTKMARPTIIARQMAIVTNAMYDAWAAYDDKAVGTRLGGKLRRPASERTLANKEEAIAHAAHRAMLYAFPQPQLKPKIDDALCSLGYQFKSTPDPSTPAGVGKTAAEAVIERYRRDGSNQEGDMAGSDGKPFSDWMGYVCANTADVCHDPHRWQPKWFTLPDGTRIAPGGLTPQWGRLKTIALTGGNQFRPGPPPSLEDPRLKAEVDEVIRYTATLTPEQKALIEFMRDGPRSTGQSGHWLRFAQDLSRRDRYTLDQDVKLFFAVGAVCHDAFIACWDAKYTYDSPRPQALVRYFYKGKSLPGWLGYGKGVGVLAAEQWKNYSPDYFVCPPFPSYPSGHSTVSGAAARTLKHFSGSDWFGFCAPRVPGSITHEPMDKVVLLELPSFTATAEMAGISRIMGGYHTQCDNITGLALGRDVSDHSWPVYQSYFDGTATVRP